MKPNRLHTRLMLIGVGLALLLILTIEIYSQQLYAQIESKGRACSRAKWAALFEPDIPPENRKPKDTEVGDGTEGASLRDAFSEITNPWNRHPGVCDHVEIRRLIKQDKDLREFSPSGAQSDLWRTIIRRDELEAAQPVVNYLAAGLAGLMSLPFLWYFTLARLREVLDVLLGRR